MFFWKEHWTFKGWKQFLRLYLWEVLVFSGENDNIFWRLYKHL